MSQISARPAYDPELAGAMDEILASGAPTGITADRIQELRDYSALYVVSDESYEGVRLEDQAGPGPEGAPDIGILVITPDDLDPTERHPGMLYIHGGGMISGDRRTAIAPAVSWARELGMVVASVEYRLAPEHPGSALVEDCYAGLVWFAANADALGVDPERIVVAGGSAGGGLAAGVALMSRDLGGPRLVGQLLMCPMLDDRTATREYPEFDDGTIWTTTANATGWRAVLGDDVGAGGVSPYVSPGRATDLSQLPPAFIDVGSAELFRDEDVNYATRIWQAGGDAALHVWPGGYHGYDGVAPESHLGRETAERRLRWLQRLLLPQGSNVAG